MDWYRLKQDGGWPFVGCGGLSLGFEANGFKTMDMKWMKMFQIHTTKPSWRCITGKLTPESIYPKADIIIGGAT